MFLRRQTTPFDYRFAPITSQVYNPGVVSGVRSLDLNYDLGGGFTITTAQFLAGVENEFAMIPADIRQMLVIGRRGKPVRMNQLVRGDGPAYLGVVNGAGGLFFDPTTFYVGNAANSFGPPMTTWRRQRANGTVVSDMYLGHTTTHELGHAVDYNFYASQRVMQTALWSGLWNRVQAVGIPWNPGTFNNPTYGYTNATEWFAEVWTLRLLGQTDGTWVTAFPGTYNNLSVPDINNRYKPSYLMLLAGGDQAIYDDLLAAFTTTFPSLQPYITQYEPGFDLATYLQHRQYDAGPLKAQWEALTLKVGQAVSSNMDIARPDLVRSGQIISGQLPPGLALTNPGFPGFWPRISLTGTPTTAGTYSATISLTNHSSLSPTVFALNLVVQP